MKTAISKVFSAELDGIEARRIEVETDIGVGLHSFTIVGLADKALSEAKERVNAALKNSGLKAPNRENRKIVVNLAPADVKKTGSQYDLAIAIGYLLTSKQIKSFETKKKLFVGELGLDGSLRPIQGALNIARMAHEKGFEEILLPITNAKEAALIPEIVVTPIESLHGLIAHLEGTAPIAPFPQTHLGEVAISDIDIGDIKGQHHAKRALSIAAAGGHNLLMMGPPGTGKTMLAQSLTSILPPPTLDEVIEMTQIWSAANVLGSSSYVGVRPFRSPHQTASPVAIVGGGGNPRPGEISLAHRGVLFLDELPEFRRDLLEALRQPLESGTVTISRARNNLHFPARFILIAAMNPCPCGYAGDAEKECKCNAHEVFRYQKKISGPLLDRIDMQITLPRINIEDLQKAGRDTAGAEKIRQSVLDARERQRARFIKRKSKKKIIVNAELSSKECEELIDLDQAAMSFLKTMFKKEMLSPRGYYRVLKTARTIADLENAERVHEDHLAEAWSFRVQAARE